MSAWLATNGHIDALVQGLLVHGIITPDEITSTGQLLWDENDISVAFRYSEERERPVYEPHLIEAPLDWQQVHVLLESYCYQACEHEEWDASRAFDLMRRLEDQLVTRHGTRPIALMRNDDYAWAISDIIEATISYRSGSGKRTA